MREAEANPLSGENKSEQNGMLLASCLVSIAPLLFSSSSNLSVFSFFNFHFLLRFIDTSPMSAYPIRTVSNLRFFLLVLYPIFISPFVFTVPYTFDQYSRFLPSTFPLARPLLGFEYTNTLFYLIVFDTLLLFFEIYTVYFFMNASQ